MVHEFQKKKRPVVSRGRIYVIIVAILILFFFVLLIPANFKIAKRKAELMQRYYSLKKEVDDLKSKNSKIEAEILNTSNNFYWEEKIRSIGFKKQGEEQVVIIAPEGNPEREATTSEKSILDSIKEFFNRFTY